MIMEWEDSFDIAPFAGLGYDTRTAFFSQTCDHLIDQAMALCICQRLLDESLGRVLNRFDLTNTVKPIAHARAIHDLSYDILITGLDEDK